MDHLEAKPAFSPSVTARSGTPLHSPMARRCRQPLARATGRVSCADRRFVRRTVRSDLLVEVGRRNEAGVCVLVAARIVVGAACRLIKFSKTCHAKLPLANGWIGRALRLDRRGDAHQRAGHQLRGNQQTAMVCLDLDIGPFRMGTETLFYRCKERGECLAVNPETKKRSRKHVRFGVKEANGLQKGLDRLRAGRKFFDGPAAKEVIGNPSARHPSPWLCAQCR